MPCTLRGCANACLDERHGDLDAHRRLRVLRPNGKQEQRCRRGHMRKLVSTCARLPAQSAPAKKPMAPMTPAVGITHLKLFVHSLHSWPAAAHVAAVRPPKQSCATRQRKPALRTPWVVADVTDGAHGTGIAARTQAQLRQPRDEASSCKGCGRTLPHRRSHRLARPAGTRAAWGRRRAAPKCS